MIRAARFAGRALNIVGALWSAWVLFIMAARLVATVAAHGFWRGWTRWAEEYSPYNLPAFISHMIGWSPAIVAFFAAAALRDWVVRSEVRRSAQTK